LIKPFFCPTRHSKYKQLAHSCYAVTDFSGIKKSDISDLKQETTQIQYNSTAVLSE